MSIRKVGKEKCCVCGASSHYAWKTTYRENKKYTLCGDCTNINVSKSSGEYISRRLKKSDIKQNEFVIRDKHGDPMSIGQAPEPLPNKVRNL